MLHSCHEGIKGSDLTAESTDLKVLMLWDPFKAVKHHVEVLFGLWFRLNRHALSGGGVFRVIVLLQT